MAGTEHTDDGLTVGSEERRAYMAALAHRCRKIIELAENEQIATVPQAQKVLLGGQIIGVLMVAFAIAPKEARASMMEWVFKQLRASYGRCLACGESAEGNTQLCAGCLADVLLEVDALQLGITTPTREGGV